MTLEQKIDELTSLIKAMDTKMMFVMDDIEQLKQDIESLKEMSIQTAMMISTSADSSSTGNKSQRLEAFRQQTARW
jgi:hypothetical protein